MRCLLPFLLVSVAFFKANAQAPGDNFFAAWVVHEIHFDFAQTSFWDSLTVNYTLDQYMAANVSIDGIAYPNSGVKYKGNSSYNNPGAKKPFRIDLSEYTDGQAHDGLKKWVLNNGFKDPTMLREKIMLDFLNENQVVAPRAAFAKLFVNGQYRGIYTVVEDVNKTFLEDRFGNKNGNLFKGDPKGTLAWKGWGQPMYQNDYELKTNETENNWMDLIRAINVLNNTPLAQLPDSLPAYIHLDSWFDYWAAHTIFVNLDSYIGSGHNYFVYHNTETAQLEWITWDVNEAFGNFQMNLSLTALKNMAYNHIQNPNARPMMAQTLAVDDFQQAFEEHTCALLARFSNAILDPKIDSLANLIRADLYADPFKFFTNSQFELNLEQDLMVSGVPGANGILGLKSFVLARRNALIQQLAQVGCTVSNTDIPAPDGLAVFPNPCSDILHIRSVWPSEGTAHLLDLTGKSLLQRTINSGGWLALPTQQLPAGMYLLQISYASGASIIRKIAVQ